MNISRVHKGLGNIPVLISQHTGAEQGDPRKVITSLAKVATELWFSTGVTYTRNYPSPWDIWQRLKTFLVGTTEREVLLISTG